jgi:hypothetical protein
MKFNPQRWQFTVRGMMLFTMSVALGIAAALSYLKYWDSLIYYRFKDQYFNLRAGNEWGVFIVVIFWLMVGLFYQVYDLWKSYFRCGILTLKEKTPWWYAIFWRLSVLTLTAMLITVNFLADGGFFVFPVNLVDHPWINKAAWEGLLLVLLIVTVGSIPTLPRSSKRSWRQWGIHFLSILFFFVLCLILWTNWTYPSFEYLATTVLYDAAERYSAIDLAIYNVRTVQVFWGMIAMCVLALVNWSFCGLLARQWEKGWKRRLLWTGLTCAGTVVVAAYMVWFERQGLREISPYYVWDYVQIRRQLHLFDWIVIAVLILVLVTLNTIMNLTWKTPALNSSSIFWRLNSRRYVHEKRWFLLLLAGTVLWTHFGLMLELELKARNVPSTGKIWLLSIFDEPLGYLWLALVIIALQRAFAPRPSDSDPALSLAPFSPARFAAIWTATLAVVVTAIPVFIWMSFFAWFHS